jgi:hypothetical protein
MSSPSASRLAMALMPGTPTQRGVSSTSGVITPSWQLASRIFHGLTAPASAHSVHVALKSFVAHGEILAAVVEGVVPLAPRGGASARPASPCRTGSPDSRVRSAGGPRSARPDPRPPQPRTGGLRSWSFRQIVACVVADQGSYPNHRCYIAAEANQITTIIQAFACVFPFLPPPGAWWWAYEHFLSSVAVFGLGIIGSTWARHLDHDGVLTAAWNRTPQPDFPRWVDHPRRRPGAPRYSCWWWRIRPPWKACCTAWKVDWRRAIW